MHVKIHNGYNKQRWHIRLQAACAKRAKKHLFFLVACSFQDVQSFSLSNFVTCSSFDYNLVSLSGVPDVFFIGINFFFCY